MRAPSASRSATRTGVMVIDAGAFIVCGPLQWWLILSHQYLLCSLVLGLVPVTDLLRPSTCISSTPRPRAACTAHNLPGAPLGQDDRDVVCVEAGPHGGVRHQPQEAEGGGSGHRWNVADADHL